MKLERFEHAVGNWVGFEAEVTSRLGAALERDGVSWAEWMPPRFTVLARATGQEPVARGLLYVRKAPEAVAAALESPRKITWRTRDMSREACADLFGAGRREEGERFIREIEELGKDAAISRFRTLSWGAWNACERERYAAFMSLATALGWGGHEGV